MGCGVQTLTGKEKSIGVGALPCTEFLWPNPRWVLGFPSSSFYRKAASRHDQKSSKNQGQNCRKINEPWCSPKGLYVNSCSVAGVTTKSWRDCALIWDWQPRIKPPVLLLLCRLLRTLRALLNQGLWAPTFFPRLRFPPALATYSCHGWIKEGARQPTVSLPCFHLHRLPSDFRFSWKQLGHDTPIYMKSLNLSSGPTTEAQAWSLCWPGDQVNKQAAMSLDLSVAFTYTRFPPVPASQGLFWQVLFCKLDFILFLLRKIWARRSPTGIFWTDASQTVRALKSGLKIFSAVLHTKKKISTGNISKANESPFWIQTRFSFFQWSVILW